MTTGISRVFEKSVKQSSSRSLFGIRENAAELELSIIEDCRVYLLISILTDIFSTITDH